jgi:hypothetical protein
VDLAGNITAKSGKIGGAIIGADFVRSTNYVAGVAGWYLSPTSAQFPASAIIGNITGAQLADGSVSSAKFASAVASDNFNGTIDGAGEITGIGTVGWALSRAGKLVLDVLAIRNLADSGASLSAVVYSGAGSADMSAALRVTRVASKGFAASIGVTGTLTLFYTQFTGGLGAPSARLAIVESRIRAVRVSDSLTVVAPWHRQHLQLEQGILWTSPASHFSDAGIALSWAFVGGYWVDRTRPPGTSGIPLLHEWVPGALDPGDWDVYVDFGVRSFSDEDTVSSRLIEARFDGGFYYFEHAGSIPRAGRLPSAF